MTLALNDAILIGSAYLTAIVSGVLGMGGGILLLTVMAQFFSLSLLIPLHALVQLGSNVSRVGLHVTEVNRKIVLLYALGTGFGVAAGSQVVLDIPEGPYKVGLGVFILAVTFLPRPAPKRPFRFKWPVVGAGASFLGLFVGATGPLIAPFFLSESLGKRPLIATKAACQVFTHLAKVIAFFAMGFTVGGHLGLLAGMLLAVFLGNATGKRILNFVSDVWFYRLFKALIVVLCGRMIVLGLS